MALLEVTDLSVRFKTDDGTVQAVDRVSLELESGQVLAVVGESGSGKSVTAMSILRLLPSSATVTGTKETPRNASTRTSPRALFLISR